MTARSAVCVGIALVLFAGSGRAYSILSHRWPSGTTIVMQLQQGSSGGTLKDGSPDWNTVTDGALGIWNQYLNANSVSFKSVPNSTAQVALGNRLNNVFWSSTVYGQSFGDAVAVTESLSIGTTTVETDVIFNNNLSWNSYQGNLVPSTTGDTLYDLRRVALHEFGHVLGLDHPDQHGQTVTSIMNSRASDIDRLRIDDINGARSIYGLSALPFNLLRAGDASFSVLFPGEALVSTSSRYQLAYQTDGNVVLYDSQTHGALWSTGTAGTSGGRLTMQTDGNLVLYDHGGSFHWASASLSNSTTSAVLQDDGNVVVYTASGSPIWHR